MKKAEKSKLDGLRDQIIELVKDFVDHEGDISLGDLGELFGPSGLTIYATLLNSPISFPRRVPKGK